MARLVVEGSDLVVRLNPLESVGALHRSVRVPLAGVVSVEPSEALWSRLRGLRAPGTGFPGVVALGTWRYSGGKDFAAVYRGRGVIVELSGAQWKRLLVSVSEPHGTTQRIESQRQPHR